MTTASPVPRSSPGRGPRRGPRIAIVGAIGIVAAVVVTAALVWFVFFSSEAPEAPTLEGAVAVLASPGPENGNSADPSAATAAVSGASEAEATQSGAAAETDGTWVLDTSIGGSVDDGSYVGFRVAEVLERIGEAEAIGRTPSVSGWLTLSGTTLESATIEADLTRIASDQSRRDPAIQRALDTGSFPVATFESSEAVELPSMPTADEVVDVAVPGVLTIHGQSQDVMAKMQAQRVGDVVVVIGTLPADFSSFGISMPSAPIVVSVEDSGDLEWQLFFRRQA